MPKKRHLPVALTIAGSDSGGGAGIQADLQTFAALGVHGATAITSITAQNPRAVCALQPCRPKLVRAQIEAVFDQLPPAAVKTGLLFSKAIIEEVALFFKNAAQQSRSADASAPAVSSPPLVVDPVMAATSGASLFHPSALKALTQHLLPRATLVTPNLAEAQALTGRALLQPEDLRWAAREIYRRYGCAALVKGGHLRNLAQAIDIFYDGETELLLTAPFVRGLKTHGTGCTYSAAITAFLARGLTLPEAVGRSKQFVTQAIDASDWAGQHPVLGWKRASPFRRSGIQP